MDGGGDVDVKGSDGDEWLGGKRKESGVSFVAYRLDDP